MVQTCSDPQVEHRLRWQVLSLLLQREGYEELAEKCIFVAGHKASTCNSWQAFPWEGVSSTWPMKGTVWNLEPVTMWDFRVRWSRRMWPLLQFKCFVLPVPGSLCNLLWQVTTDRLAIPFSHPAETWGMRLNRYLFVVFVFTDCSSSSKFSGSDNKSMLYTDDTGLAGYSSLPFLSNSTYQISDARPGALPKQICSCSQSCSEVRGDTCCPSTPRST